MCIDFVRVTSIRHGANMMKPPLHSRRRSPAQRLRMGGPLRHPQAVGQIRDGAEHVGLIRIEHYGSPLTCCISLSRGPRSGEKAAVVTVTSTKQAPDVNS